MYAESEHREEIGARQCSRSLEVHISDVPWMCHIMCVQVAASAASPMWHSEIDGDVTTHYVNPRGKKKLSATSSAK